MMVNQWIDRELKWHAADLRTIEGEELDRLLELREFISNLDQLAPASVVRGYFRFKRVLEIRHYLLFYRLRGWLSGTYQILVADPLDRSPAEIFELDLGARDLEQALTLAKSQFFERAEPLISFSDLRCRIEIASE